MKVRWEWECMRTSKNVWEGVRVIVILCVCVNYVNYMIVWELENLIENILDAWECVGMC